MTNNEVKVPNIENLHQAVRELQECCNYYDKLGRETKQNCCSLCPFGRNEECCISDTYPSNWNIVEKPVIKLTL